MPIRHSNYPLCRHTKTNGLRCQSPALVTSAYCYHHQKVHHTRPRTIDAPVGPGLSTNVLYPLRNARDIQQAIEMVFSGVVSGRIHPRASSKMLYALQTAMSNLR